MTRYCANCKEDFEFNPLAVSGKEDLICPQCGSIINKNSRRPSTIDTDKTEENIGNAIAGIWGIAYMFYITLAVIGIIGFFFSDKLLYAMAIIAVVAFVIQLITGTTAFTEGIILLPIGSVALSEISYGIFYSE